MWTKVSDNYEDSLNDGVDDSAYWQFMRDNATNHYIDTSKWCSGKFKSPQQSWMFDVAFYFTSAAERKYNLKRDQIETDPSFKCIKADLPKMQFATKEFFFLGSKKTIPIYKDPSGETTLEFWLQSDIVKIGDQEIYYENDLLSILIGEDADDDYFHPEFDDPLFETIEIVLRNSDGSPSKKIRLLNPVVTNIETGGSVSYDSEDGLKVTLTVHYDDWRLE